MSLNTDPDRFYQEAKSLLSKPNEDGVNLFDHVGELLLRIVEDKPADAFKLFEQLSLETKQDSRPRAKQTGGKDLEHLDAPAWKESLENCVKLFRTLEEVQEDRAAERAALAGDGSDEDEVEEEDIELNEGELPDLIEEAQMLQWAGTGFGQTEAYRLQLALKDLLESQPLQSVRLFGKIFGTKSDYIIAECLFKDGEGESDAEGEGEEEGEAVDDEGSDAEGSEAEDPHAVPVPKVKPPVAVPKEQREGVNKYTYFVCSHVGDEWRRLPSVTPEQIMAARGIKKYFTGDLYADVLSHPPFPGTEAHYLRAQIARIAHACTVSPRGFFVSDEDEDDPTLSKNEEFEELNAEELMDLSNWVHHEPKILLQGRTKHFAPEEEEEEEEEPEEEEDEDDEGKIPKPKPTPTPQYLLPEEAPPLLEAVGDDEPIVEETHPSWTARLCRQLTSDYACVSVVNHKWPGACAVARGAQFANIYIGYGHKWTDTAYTPQPLPEVQEEPAAKHEKADPTVEAEAEFEKKDDPEEGEEEPNSDDSEDED